MTLYLAIIITTIALDQISKYLAVAFLKPIGTLPIIKNALHLTYSENTGAAFSILRGKQLFLISITILAMLFMLGYLYKWSQVDGQHWQKMCFALIIGGGIGNLIDRIRIGYVVDFIDFRLINFAIFNVADSFIVVGVIALMTLLIFKPQW